MLDASLKAQLSAYLEMAKRPIHITAYADASEKSVEMMDLLADLSAASPKVVVERDDSADVRRPSFALGSPGQDIHLTFAGLPMGHEFTSLVLALLQVGGHPPKASADVIEQIRALESSAPDGKLRFETYFSQSCQNCPDVVQALNLMAVLNPKIEHVAIDGAVFPEEVEARGVMSVPMLYLNGQHFGQGRIGDGALVVRFGATIDGKQ